MAMDTTPLHEQGDADRLRSFGYEPRLARNMGGFSAFAVSFSLISVLTGIFANFNFGYREAGDGILWTWSLVAAGQTLIAIVMARLAVRFPIAGYGYQWAARLMGTGYGFFVGWFLLLQFVTGFPGICQTFATTLATLTGGADTDTVRHITVAVILGISAIHLAGIRWAARINDLGVYAELAGVAGLLLLLAGAWLMSGHTTPATAPIGGTGLSGLARSLLLGAFCLTGFEAAADLAEETRDPVRQVPRAVMTSHISAALSGLATIALLLLCARTTPDTPTHPDPLGHIIRSAIGTRLSAFLGWIVLLSVLACGVASMATASRLVFSLARDNVLPLSNRLSEVTSRTQTPRNAILLVTALSIAAIYAFQRIEIITGISAVAAFTGYAGIMLAVRTDQRRNGTNTPPGMQRTLPTIALAWSVSVVIALTLPETELPGSDFRHWPAAATLAAAGLGTLLWHTHVRQKIGKGLAGPPNARKQQP
jgi:amino acid transporter